MEPRELTQWRGAARLVLALAQTACGGRARRQPLAADRLREVGQADHTVAHLRLAALQHARDRGHIPEVDLHRDCGLQVLRHRGGNLLDQFV